MTSYAPASRRKWKNSLRRLAVGTIGTGAASLSTLLLFVEVPHEKIPEVVLEDVVLETELCVCA
jgi:hypothetical protein